MQFNHSSTSVRDIAEQAGVTPAVVSAVLRGGVKKGVRYSDATALRVKSIADKLGYVPNRLTQSLIKQEAFAIGVLSAWAHHDRYNMIIRGLADKCHAGGYHLILEPCNFDHKEILSRLRSLVSLQVGAVVMIPSSSLNVDPEIVMQEHLEKLALCKNIICVDWFKDELIFDCIEPNEVLMVDIPVQHLVERGHRNIAFIGNGTPSRRKCLARVMEKYSIQDGLQNALTGFVSDQNIVLGDIPGLTRKILNNSPCPTAIYCWQDSYAAVVYRICEEEFGLKVGRDIALIGQDNTPLCQFLPTPLTSLSHRDEDLAGMLFDMIANRLSGRLATGPVRKLVEPKLIVRKSTQFYV